VGESGFGRVHGEAGLRKFSLPTAVARQRFRLPLDLTGFERPAGTAAALARLTRLRHGRR